MPPAATKESPIKTVQELRAVIAEIADAPVDAAQAKAENLLTGSLRTLFANVEAYPTLKSNENVMQLQEQLTSTENQIGFSRQHYNASVLAYNTSIQSFPGVLFAADHAIGQRVDRPLPAENQLVEALRIAPNGARHELVVCERHPRDCLVITHPLRRRRCPSGCRLPCGHCAKFDPATIRHGVN